MAQTLDTGKPPEADKVLGRWVSQAQDSQTEIFKSGGTYSGTLLAGWGNNLYEKDGKTLKKDTKNPDAALRSQTLLNAVILSGLEYRDGEYQNGRCYDARTGKTFGCTMRMRGEGLEIRIYWKFSLLGVTKKWTRIPG
ncbi:hypothetical protein AXW84_21955 [Hymenobacter sp. PAMC 26628]|nr:hypothetical protein AXW84_21955 [Hymenobacter sp. PAMC 26628]